MKRSVPEAVWLALTIAASLLGGAAWSAFEGGSTRLGLQLSTLIVGCFAVMVVNKRRYDAAQAPGQASGQASGPPPSGPAA